MIEQKQFKYLCLVFLFAAFGFISLLVVLTRQHPFWLKKKLWIGGLILSLSSLQAGCPARTCYISTPPAPEGITVDQADVNQLAIQLDRAQADTLSGTVNSRHSPEFSFAVVDSQNVILQKDNLNARDGDMDEAEEEFTITVDAGIPAGDYFLNFYACNKDSIAVDLWVARFSIAVR